MARSTVPRVGFRQRRRATKSAKKARRVERKRLNTELKLVREESFDENKIIKDVYEGTKIFDAHLKNLEVLLYDLGQMQRNALMMKNYLTAIREKGNNELVAAIAMESATRKLDKNLMLNARNRIAAGETRQNVVSSMNLVNEIVTAARIAANDVVRQVADFDKIREISQRILAGSNSISSGVRKMEGFEKTLRAIDTDISKSLKRGVATAEVLKTIEAGPGLVTQAGPLKAQKIGRRGGERVVKKVKRSPEIPIE